MLQNSLNKTLERLYLKKKKLLFLIFVWIYSYRFSDHHRFARTYFCKSTQNLHNLQKLLHAKVYPNKVIKF